MEVAQDRQQKLVQERRPAYKIDPQSSETVSTDAENKTLRKEKNSLREKRIFLRHWQLKK